MFSWQCQNLCLLSLRFITDWRVVRSKLDAFNNWKGFKFKDILDLRIDQAKSRCEACCAFVSIHNVFILLFYFRMPPPVQSYTLGKVLIGVGTAVLANLVFLSNSIAVNRFKPLAAEICFLRALLQIALFSTLHTGKRNRSIAFLIWNRRGGGSGSTPPHFWDNVDKCQVF